LLKTMLKNDLKLSGNNISKRIALNLYGTFPVIYAAAMHMNVVAVRWKWQIAENAKTLSSSHEYPEMNHNEIVGWCRPRSLLKEFMIINLRDKKDHPRVKIRMDVTNSILKRSGFKVMELISKGDTLLSRMMSLVYIGDFVSFYLAVLNKIDPTPVERIAYLKGKLAGK
ncbi:MAG: bifunctional phosphoglucose/phosphomannose isomerase, partial [Bacteroidetes bacterium]|nr:bifunctional phosphoglucose/phosphomannose isomerase [Bacteroidota bacterium]